MDHSPNLMGSKLDHDTPSECFHEDLTIGFYVLLLTKKERNRQRNAQEFTASLAEVIIETRPKYVLG